MPDEFEKKLVQALEDNNLFRGLATVIRTSSGTRKIPIAEDTGEASWIDEGEEIPESDTTFSQTIQKWDGKLPTVTGSSALVGIDAAE